jgi:hypothetical protein
VAPVVDALCHRVAVTTGGGSTRLNLNHDGSKVVDEIHQSWLRLGRELAR